MTLVMKIDRLSQITPVSSEYHCQVPLPVLDFVHVGNASIPASARTNKPRASTKWSSDEYILFRRKHFQLCIIYGMNGYLTTRIFDHDLLAISSSV